LFYQISLIIEKLKNSVMTAILDTKMYILMPCWKTWTLAGLAKLFKR